MKKSDGQSRRHDDAENYPPDDTWLWKIGRFLTSHELAITWSVVLVCLAVFTVLMIPK